MNLLEHNWPHTMDCTGCRVMEQARQSILYRDGEIKTPSSVLENQITPSDTKELELCALLEEVLETTDNFNDFRRFSTPHHECLPPDLVTRIHEALAE